MVKGGAEGPSAMRSKRSASIDATSGSPATRCCSSSVKYPSAPAEPGCTYRSARTTPESQSSSETRKENTIIAMATHSDALTTIPATLAARCPGRSRTWASASMAMGESFAMPRESARRHRGATETTEAASQSVIVA
jgi:hypothetical protein